ncbi:MAG TPA: formylglycine-generating enzyme family protein [Nitrospiraceae bacterium]|nr:formylglycine-generating enzyme family protein [Nitrospiraceae bacterium]
MHLVWTLILSSVILTASAASRVAAESPTAGSQPKDLPGRLTGIAGFITPSPVIAIPAGWFLMGSTRVDDDPYGLQTQYDDTELPQHKVWLDAYDIDRDEVSLGEYLAFLRRQKRPVSDELRKLIWHMVTVHAATDEGLARWPALYVTWAEASDFCHYAGKRLPTEAEWEKAARGTAGNLFPWGSRTPEAGLAVFNQYHVHEIPLVQEVGSGDEGRSPYGAHHMAGNVAEWVQDWFGFDYYSITPDRNPAGPAVSRYKGVRGGSWKSKPMMLRAATRSGAPPDQRAPTIGFRCAKSSARR